MERDAGARRSAGLRGRQRGADRQQLIGIMPAKRRRTLTSAAPTQTYDVAVLGGGTIGLSVAWRARARGLDVIVLDRGALGAGASHVAAGMLAPVAEADPGERPLLALGMESARRWPTFAQELEDVSGLACGFRAVGTLVVARDRDELEAVEREVALRERLGIAVERLLPSAARRREPALAPTVRGAFHASGDHCVDPRAVCAALAVAAERAGVVLRPGAAIERVDPATGSVVLAGGERVVAGQLVGALGAWSGALPGAAPVPVRPVKGQTLRLRGAALLDGVVRFEGGYLVPRADGRVVLGATTEERGFDTSVTALGLYELLRDASELVPGVLELEVEETIAGLRPGTPDNAPILGRGEDGVVWATGHHRNGVLLTPVTADLLAGLLAGEDDAALAPFGPARFVREAA
ncbi:MAG: glycine oxidase [Solirubrobacteraceae bacterium]|jgi:glycine oxidase|nr:glycine oxidase [Solirubrobacteraceae bacterium]